MLSFTDELDSSRSEQEIEYQSLYNALYWTDGFGLFFVQCTPAQGRQLIARLNADMLHDKQIVLLYLDQQPDKFFQEIQQASNADILFISGIEKSLNDYIKEGFGGQGCYYKEDSVPRILGFLNLARERLKIEFPHLSFVFLLPNFGMKFCMRRAKDFFDWHSGVFRFDSQHPCYQPTPKPTQTIKYGNTLKLKLRCLFKRTHIFGLGVLTTLPFACIGECFILLGKYEVALLLYQKMTSLKPKYAMFWNSYGKVLFNLGNDEQARDQFNKALAINPTHAASWCNKGYILIQQQHYEQAIACFDKALKNKPNLTKAWLGRGEALCELKCYNEARQAFEQALVVNPNNLKAQLKYDLMGKYLDHFDQTLNNFQKSLSGMSQKPNDTKEKALAKLAELSQKHPNHAIVLRQYAYALYYLDRYEKAAEHYAKAITLNPNDESAWFNHGLMMESLKHYEKAACSYGITTDINPSNQEAWSHQGYAFEQLDRSLDAVMSYNQLIELNPNAKDIWHRRDVLLKKLGEHEIRKRNYRKVLKLYPKNTWLWCQQGELLDELGENEEAIDCFANTVNLNPDDEWAWYKYGHSLEKLGQYEEAIAKYNIAI